MSNGCIDGTGRETDLLLLGTQLGRLQMRWLFLLLLLLVRHAERKRENSLGLTVPSLTLSPYSN